MVGRDWNALTCQISKIQGACCSGHINIEYIGLQAGNYDSRIYSHRSKYCTFFKSKLLWPLILKKLKCQSRFDPLIFWLVSSFASYLSLAPHAMRYSFEGGDKSTCLSYINPQMCRSHLFQMKGSSVRYRRVHIELTVRFKLKDSLTEKLVRCKWTSQSLLADLMK